MHQGFALRVAERRFRVYKEAQGFRPGPVMRHVGNKGWREGNMKETEMGKRPARAPARAARSTAHQPAPRHRGANWN
jgi:hypothetical protein